MKKVIALFKEPKASQKSLDNNLFLKSTITIILKIKLSIVILISTVALLVAYATCLRKRKMAYVMSKNMGLLTFLSHLYANRNGLKFVKIFSQIKDLNTIII